MSALNLIIARGFGPEIKELGTIMGDEKNRQQAHNTDLRSAQINQQGAMQNQQFDAQEMQRRQQEGQEAALQQRELEDLFNALPDLEARLRANPNDPNVIREAMEHSARLNARINPKEANAGLSDLLYPKQGFQTVTGAQLNQQYNTRLPEGNTYQVDPQTGKITALDKVPQTVVNVGQTGPQLTHGQKKVDERFAQEYVDFNQGGAADAAKSIDELSSALTFLRSSSGGTATGPGVGLLPKGLRDVTPGLREGANVQEMVESTVQRSLREILGAQFTEKEGERLIARAYNPRLPPDINATRVERLLTQLQRAYESKQAAAQYYEQNGTLQGFTGKTSWRMSDFNPEDKNTLSGPRVGTVEDGYRFKGGDPADPASWVKTK